MPKVEPQVPPGDYELPPIAGRHNGFVVATALLFVVLFLERGLYAFAGAGRRSAGEAAVALALSAVLIFLGVLASFYLPSRLRPEGDQTRWIPHTLDFLLGQWAIAGAAIAAAALATLLLFAYLVYPDTYALASLIQDIVGYTALAVLIYHGFVTFVRYQGFLYQTGGADRGKTIAFEVGGAFFMVLIGLYMYTIDTVKLLNAGPGAGLLAMHLTFAHVWLGLMLALIFIWQIGRAGDH